MDAEFGNQINSLEKLLLEFEDLDLKTNSNLESNLLENREKNGNKDDHVNKYINIHSDGIVNIINDVRARLQWIESELETTTELNKFKTIQIQDSKVIKKLKDLSCESALISVGRKLEQMAFQAQKQIAEIRQKLEIEVAKSKDLENKFSHERDLNRRYLTRINFLNEALEKVETEKRVCQEKLINSNHTIHAQNAEIEKLRRENAEKIKQSEEEKLRKEETFRALEKLVLEMESKSLTAINDAEHKIKSLEKEKRKLTKKLKKVEEDVEENPRKLFKNETGKETQVIVKQENSSNFEAYQELAELLPASNLEKFIDFETKLSWSSEICAALEYYLNLHLTKTNDPEVGLRTILPLMITSDVQNLYNLQEQLGSRSGKFNFSTTQTYQLIKKVMFSEYNINNELLNSMLDSCLSNFQ